MLARLSLRSRPLGSGNGLSAPDVAARQAAPSIGLALAFAAAASVPDLLPSEQRRAIHLHVGLSERQLY